MRAKSIKNKARINAELSPAELKALLKKAQRDVGNYQNYITLVETELSTWRSGGSVDKAQWASMEKALGLQPGEANALANKADNAQTASGRATPRTQALGNLRDLESRPQTPTTVSMDKDEREDFLRRENELTDQLLDKVGQICLARRVGLSRCP
jgi:kinesin family protein 5